MYFSFLLLTLDVRLGCPVVSSDAKVQLLPLDTVCDRWSSTGGAT